MENANARYETSGGHGRSDVDVDEQWLADFRDLGNGACGAEEASAVHEDTREMRELTF